MSGVTCDFCHTITGFKGTFPGSGNYIAAPGNQKLGPFKHKSTWHHIYSELQTKSEFCAICHNAVNRYGLEVKSTFTEWKYSRYAEEGIQCQDCHMNVQGFLAAGKPEYESGKAARMTLGYLPHREKLYTHRFPGAHSKTQVIGALTLDIKTEKAIVSPSNVISVYVSVDNSRTGHKMPSGSADLRMLWIDLEAFIGNRVMSISASSDAKTNKYDISGGGQFDKEILRDDIPHGKRIYRAIYIDKSGRQTLSSYNASRIVFDNRLNATEIREEVYNFAVPKDARGTLILVAKLNYLRYPSSFTDRFGMLRPESIEIATSKKELIID
jgi:hypothetical protein